MNVLELYNKYVTEHITIPWSDYYRQQCLNLHRKNKQRNYKRNGDIIYKSNPTFRNNVSTGYELVFDGQFVLNENILSYSWKDTGYSANTKIDKIRPFAFMTMDINNDMQLIADVPNLIIYIQFEIDENGFLKYG